MPLIVLGLIAVVGALILIFTAKKPSAGKRGRVVNASYKVSTKDPAGKPKEPEKGKVIHLYGEDKERGDD